jgi:fused signal recognition particle receptor
MALKAFWDRLRGRDPASPQSPAAEPEPTPPPPVVPLPPDPFSPPPYATTPAVPELPPVPPPVPEPPPRPAPPIARDERGAVEEALASTEPDVPPPAPIEPEPEPAPAEARGGWLARLKAGLSRSTARLTDALTTAFRKRRLDDEALEELEETLISADLGLPASRRIVDSFRRTRFGREVTEQEIKAALADQVAEILAPVATPLVIDRARAPHVVLVVGVNGTGKTTTIAKLGQQWRREGFRVMFAAGDTFRAAAVEQLQIWGERTGCPVVAPQKPGADAAGLAHDALARARAEGAEVLLIDTAGRLHNKAALMEELRKIIRVIRKLDASAPHSVLLTLDATTGQNALSQVRTFKEMVEVTGLAVTKLDGSAKGGVVVALAQEIGLPVHMVGVGERAEDLRPFTARDFARGLVGLD